ncbi:MAG: hypothetical protein HYZ42_10780 [Bacteroidetes bacterium]|nr:hypothetical protein [Bacteroidota bacterium]
MVVNISKPDVLANNTEDKNATSVFDVSLSTTLYISRIHKNEAKYKSTLN